MTVDTHPAHHADNLRAVALSLNADGPVPLHAQVAEGVRQLVSQGTWPPGFRLPAEPELAVALGVSRGTVRRAIQTLSGEGLIVQSHGRGTFVNEHAADVLPVEQLLSIAEAMDLHGVVFETSVVVSALVTPPQLVVDALGLEDGELALHLARVRLVAGVPVAYLVNYVRASRCPGIERIDFARRRLFDVIEQDYALWIEGGNRSFEAVSATSDVARLLDVSPGTPLLYLAQRTHLADAEPIECSDVWIRGDRMKLTAVLLRRRTQPTRWFTPVTDATTAPSLPTGLDRSGHGAVASDGDS